MFDLQKAEKLIPNLEHRQSSHVIIDKLIPEQAAIYVSDEESELLKIFHIFIIQ